MTRIDTTSTTTNPPSRRHLLGAAATMGVAGISAPAFADGGSGNGATSDESRDRPHRPSSAAQHVLRLDQPAMDWSGQTLPIGNGRVGATFFGDPVHGVVQLNEISLWAGANDYDNALNGDDDGDMDTSMTGFGTYLSGGRLLLDLLGADGSDTPVKGAPLRRSLDIDTGVHTITSQAPGGVGVRQEAFASVAADLLVISVKAEAPLQATVQLDSDHDGTEISADERGRTLWATGTLGNDLVHATAVRIAATDGTIRPAADGTALEVHGATRIVLLVDQATNYARSAEDGWRGEDPAPAMRDRLDRANRRGLVALRAQHVRHMTGLTRRMQLTLPASPDGVLARPLDERLERYADGHPDPSLEQLAVAYGRYLLISSSRSGGLPANLQGLWNDSNTPAWSSDYHSNINIQMAYWPAEVTGIPETHEALIGWLQEMREPLRNATRHAFGPVEGWTARTSQSPMGGNAWEWNTVASAWYALHVLEHWAFGRDERYGREVAWPFLEEVCRFWEDRLVEQEDGTLLAPDGWSPEHGPREDGVMYDQEILRELFSGGARLAEAVGADRTRRSALAEVARKLGAERIGSWGQLQEWQEDRDDPEDVHRHTSHLFSLYPGSHITEATPELQRAARVSLLARCGLPPTPEGTDQPADQPVPEDFEEQVSGDSRRSWTWPWRAALFARLGDGDGAHAMLRGLLRFSTMSNLWATHPPFQMDGNFGLAGAVPEMLVQSHERTEGGEVLVRLLPALPSAWAEHGSVRGLRARGGLAVDVAWKGGRVTDWTVRSATRHADRHAVVVADGRQKRIRVRSGG